MSNAGAVILSTLEQEKVIIVSKGRKIDLEGFDVSDDDKTRFFKAGILPEGFKAKKADKDGSIGTDDNNIYVCGRVDVQLDDELQFCGQKGKVIKVNFWRAGNFTHIIARTVTRKAAAYA